MLLIFDFAEARLKARRNARFNARRNARLNAAPHERTRE
jgi:hypothetical protein